MKYLNKNTDLDNPRVTENYILSLEKTNKYKMTLLSAYLHYCSANGIMWVAPRLKCESVPIVVPTEERIDRIISRARAHVKYLLGHRNIETTMIYVHLAQGLTNSPEDYACKAAKNVEEASALIEQGFDYVTEFDGVKLFRKRK